MSRPRVDRLFPRLKFKIRPEPRKLSSPQGPEGRINKLRKTLTALIKYERIELHYDRADETRGYAELLISEALRHGPQHKETMELADFWLLEKQLVHKLFKVLVPRYQDYTTSFTKLHNAPSKMPALVYRRGVLELKGNLYPSLEQFNPSEGNLLHNLLLDATRKEYREQKYKEIAENMQV